MHKNTSVQTLVLAVLVITLSVLSFSGCDLLTRESISVQGVWRLAGTFGDEKWEISDQEISYYSKDLDESWAPVGEYILRYRADVITYDNDQLNGGDTQFITGNTPAVAGYAVIRYTEVVAGGDTSNGEVGRFNVFRWAVSAGDTQKRDFTQGGKYSGTWGTPDYDLLDFDTAAEAANGATVAEGYFDFASSGAAPFVEE
ncbi:MAG: hypothetical protein K9M84_06165 [Spirochaetia bacterium]|nr:hypothetical protein [Spirochaetia bacterium]MCF7941175.1 hypothetical protein [Spirochaetia bacterium]